MSRQPPATMWSVATALTGLAIVGLLAGCTNTRKLDKPIALHETGVIAAAADDRMAASIDAVIVRDGPGSWARNANWDEYLLRVRPISAEPVEVLGITIVDALDRGIAPRTNRSELMAASDATAHRYKESGIQVQPGVGASTLFAEGALALETSGMVATAALAGSSTALASTTAAAAAAVVAVPALFVAGGIVAAEGHDVDKEIKTRSTPLPLLLGADPQDRRLDVFFPLAPAPNRVLVHYRDAHGQHTLVMDTRVALAGLHIQPKETPQPATAPQTPTSTGG